MLSVDINIRATRVSKRIFALRTNPRRFGWRGS